MNKSNLNILSIIRELKQEEANLDKALKTMDILRRYTILVVIVLLGLLYFQYIKKQYQFSPEEFLISVVLIIVGGFSYLSFLKLKKRDTSGKILGQVSLGLLFIVCVSGTIWNIIRVFSGSYQAGNQVILLVVALVALFIAILSFMGIRYFGRLTVDNEGKLNG